MKKPLLALLCSAFLFATACSATTTATPVGTADLAAATETESAAAPANTTAPDEVESETVVAAPATETPATETPTEVTASEPAESDEPAAVPVVQGGGGDWCTVAAVVDGTLGEDNLDVFTDPAALEATYTELLGLVQAARSQAPPEIAADVAVFADSLAQMTALLDAADWDFLAVDIGDMTEVVSGIEQNGYNIELYNYEVCGIGEAPDEVVAIDDLLDDSFDEDLLSGSFKDILVDTYIDLGFNEDEAQCLAENFDMFDPENAADPNAIFDAFGDCDISLDRMSSLGS